MALSVEVSELVENFQWLTEEQSYTLDQQQRAAVVDEIADVQMYLLRLPRSGPVRRFTPAQAYDIRTN
jgi:dCTP diphosphatase